MKLLLMCEKSKPYVMKFIDGKYKELASFYNKQDLKDCVLLNETIVAECDYEVEEIEDRVSYFDSWFNEGHHTKTMRAKELITKSCLDYTQLTEYLGEGDPNEVVGYAIHIKNLHIFNEPKALSHYTTRKPRDYDSIVCDSCTNAVNCKKCSYYYDYQEVVRTPHNMMKVCEWDLEDKILIPLKPKDLCKVLNKEKTIIIKKKVLKEMLK
jgi:hypothetical protein